MPDGEPLRRCDVVMKGGITSGIVYPKALSELSGSFRFRNLGGTSAGAIAAGVAAAAEYGRRHGNSTAFERLEQLPRELGETVPGGRDSRLFSLFQPQAATRAVFRTLTAGLGKSGWRGPAAFVAALPRRFPLWLALGLVPGAILVWLVTRAAGHPVLQVAGGLVALLVLLLGATILPAAAFVRRVLREVPANLYGLCTGLGEAGGPPGLTPWLGELLEELAGRDPAGAPLTFGDLWGGIEPGGPAAIHLEMMTTCLSHGRPYRLPMETEIFYFHRRELSRLFPPRIVGWLVDHAEPTGYPPEGPWKDLHKLPPAHQIPVLVATRMSLSFPVLLSAVPLWAVDWTRKANKQARKEGRPPTPERCWFSDGGICSNFPVHFFDAPLPSWPSFDFNLRSFHPDYPRHETRQEENVYLVKNNASGVVEQWSRIGGEGRGSLPDFVGAILNTMQNWTDRTLLRMPGYRDRVAHVFLESDEGGLNLNMPDRVIQNVSERGRFAARKLSERFTAEPEDPGALGWDNHRWVRFRTSMFLLEEMLEEILRAWEQPPAAGRGYRELLGRGAGEAPASYRLDEDGQKAFAVAAADELIALIRKWSEDRETFAAGAPRPRPELRARPRI